jgi:hypothetical protein
MPLAPDQRAASASWVDARAKTGDLLYVSDQTTNDVYIYSYPGGKQAGTLTGFYTPNGECADAKGNVWITQFDQVAQYAHGSTARARTLYEYGLVAKACSVDPTTGDLAVVGQCGYTLCKDGAGYVAVYKQAQGRPHYYAAPSVNSYAFCSYDPQGDLFVDGSSYYYYDFELDELPRTAKRFETLTLDQAIAVPGGVAWDGRYVTVEDQSVGIIYRFLVAGSSGVLHGETTLTDASKLEQYWIGDGAIVGANYGDLDAIAWKYPRGGAPVKTYVGIEGFTRPFGIVVSR